MNSLTTGDLSTMFRRSSLVNQTKNNLETYSMEIASGLKADVSKSVSGNFTPLASMERTLRTLESYQRGIDDAVYFASSMQNVLGAVADHVDTAAAPLINSATYNSSATMQITSTETRGHARLCGERIQYACRWAGDIQWRRDPNNTAAKRGRANVRNSNRDFRCYDSRRYYYCD